ncbi:MAG: nucleotidyltransferase family protein [Candidatus Zixiibacteriota bacterium]
MVKQEIIEVLKELKDEIRRKYRAEIKGIFGSYVRGEQKEGSDVDILVAFSEGATLFDFVGLADYVEGKLNRKVDIVPIDTIREEIKENILKEAVYL